MVTVIKSVWSFRKSDGTKLPNNTLSASDNEFQLYLFPKRNRLKYFWWLKISEFPKHILFPTGISIWLSRVRTGCFD